MSDKYFLYIDILGFTDLVINNPEKVEYVFEAINRMNVHKDNAYKTIAFSDTVLIYNDFKPRHEEEEQQVVMFLCEYAADLMKWGINLDFHFKAVLLRGPFHYEKKKNIEAYYGKALIEAYHTEKNINAMGLFIDQSIAHMNTSYRMMPYNEHLNFVFITVGLRDLNLYGPGELPVDFTLLEGPTPTYLSLEIRMLKKIKQTIGALPEGRLRDKYSNTYDFYKAHYHWLVAPLEEGDFDPTIICKNVEWYDENDDWWVLDDEA